MYTHPSIYTSLDFYEFDLYEFNFVTKKLDLYEQFRFIRAFVRDYFKFTSVFRFSLIYSITF